MVVVVVTGQSQCHTVETVSRCITVSDYTKYKGAGRIKYIKLLHCSLAELTNMMVLPPPLLLVTQSTLCESCV